MCLKTNDTRCIKVHARRKLVGWVTHVAEMVPNRVSKFTSSRLITTFINLLWGSKAKRKDLSKSLTWESEG